MSRVDRDLRARVMLSCGIAIFAASLFSIMTHASASDWKNLTDQQIARLFFPNEKLYFRPTLKGLPLEDVVLDGIAVHEVKRLIANFDNDTENEMAILLRYSDGLCNYCVNQLIAAILDDHKGKLRIPWKTKENSAFDNGRTSDIWASSLIKKDKFSQLVLKYTGPSCSGCSHKWMTIVRWNGNEFTEIWTHDVEKYDHGGHSENPHQYVANVDFTRDDNPARRIRVSSIYVTFPHALEQRRQITVSEVFAWSDKEQRYIAVSRREGRYEKGEWCDSSTHLEQQQKTQEGRNCYK
jgi:hypothetical protein